MTLNETARRKSLWEEAEVLAVLRELCEELAKVCEKRAEQRCHDHGTQDPETGEWILPRGLAELNEEDDDCAAAIRRFGDEP